MSCFPLQSLMSPTDILLSSFFISYCSNFKGLSGIFGGKMSYFPLTSLMSPTDTLLSSFFIFYCSNFKGLSAIRRFFTGFGERVHIGGPAGGQTANGQEDPGSAPRMGRRNYQGKTSCLFFR